MKKLKGAANNKTIIGVVIALLVLAGAYFAYGKLEGSNNPKTEIKNAFLGVVDEYYNTSEDFMPEFGIREMSKKMNNGNLDLDANIYTDYFTPMGIDKAGLNISMKQNTKAKKVDMNMGVTIGNLPAYNIDFKALDNDIYLNAPFAYDKAFKFNSKTFGTDITNSAFAKIAGIDTEEIKDLSFNLFSNAKTSDELNKEFLNFIKAEKDTLSKNMKIEKVEVNKDVSAKLNQNELKEFTIEMNSTDVKALLNKSFDYYISMQEEQVQSFGLPTDIVDSTLAEQKNNLDSAKEDINNAKLKETVKFSVVLNKEGKLVAITALAKDIMAEDTSSNPFFNIYFAGEKNTTDNIIVDLGDDIDKINLSLKMTTTETESKYDFSLTGSDSVTVIGLSTYNKTDKTFKSSYSLVDYYEDEYKLDFNGKYEDVVKGSSYNSVFDNFTITTPYSETYNFNGNIKISAEAPEIMAPENSTEIFKLTEDEINALYLEISNNINASLSPLIQLMYGVSY